MNKLRKIALLASSLVVIMTSVAVPLSATAVEQTEGQNHLDELSDMASILNISEKLLQEIESGKQEIEVVLLFKGIDYSLIIQEVAQKAEEYRKSLDTETYTEDKINEMTGEFKIRLSDELGKTTTDTYHKEICDSLGIAVEDADFSYGGNSFVCTLTPDQIMIASKSEWLSRKILLKAELGPTDEELGYEQVEGSTEPLTETTSSTSEKVDLFSEALLAEIESGKQEIEVVLLFKGIDYLPIIQEVAQKGEEYRKSLDAVIYTENEINEMTGEFKIRLNDELDKIATDAYHKEICDSLGIAIEDADFSYGGNSLVCTLTPDQIKTASKSDWLSRKILLKAELGPTDEELGYRQELATSDEKILNWVKIDYEKKTGIAAYPKFISKSDENYMIAVKDKDGNMLDTYTIDPKTGIGTNASSEAVTLPQTGIGMSDVHKTVTGLAAIMEIVGFVLVKKSRKEDE